MKASRFLTLVFTVAVAAASVIMPTGLAAADCDKIVVTGADIAEQPENTAPTRNWVLYKRAAGDGDVRTGPATPPSGSGSYELVTPTGADKATLFNFDHVGTPLADVNKIGYSTYRTAGELQQVLVQPDGTLIIVGVEEVRRGTSSTEYLTVFRSTDRGVTWARQACSARLWS